MKETDILNESRLIALETMMTHIYNVTLKLARADEASISEAEADMLRQSGLSRFTSASKLDPVDKDQLVSEATASLERLFDIARSMRKT